MLTLKLAAVLAFALTTAAIAAEQAPAAPGAAPSAVSAPSPAKAAKAPKDKLICETEQQVGTKIAKKVCRTAERVDEDRTTALRTSENLRSKAPDAEGDLGGPAR